MDPSPVTWYPAWTKTPSLAFSSDFTCVDISARKHSQLTGPLRSPSLPTCLLCPTRLLGFSKDRDLWWGGGAEYFYLNCGRGLSSLPSGSLSRLGHIHVTHACLHSRIRCLGWLSVLPSLQVREQLQWGWGLCAHGHTHTLPMCPQLDLGWTVSSPG